MEESEASLEDQFPNKGRGLLAFFYSDALVNTERLHSTIIMRESVRLAYKEVRRGELCTLKKLLAV